MNTRRGFTLIELLIVIAIIALLSSVVLSTLTASRVKARDAQRIANAHQLGIALAQHEISTGSYLVAGSGYMNSGSGFVGKVDVPSNYTTSIASILKTEGNYSRSILKDPVFGDDNYYLGICATSSGYTLFLKVEQSSLQLASTTVAAACDGVTAASKGFNYISDFAGAGSSGLGGSGGGGGGGYVAAVGSIDPTFTVGTGFNGEVFELEAQPDGKILAGGDFTTYNGTGRTRIARLNTDGTLDGSFTPGSGADGIIYAIKVLSDGKIMIGGNFFNYNGTAVSRVARLNSDGTIDATFNPGTGPNSYITSLQIQSDGKVIIAGGFSMYNGSGVMGIARLLSSGAIDESFDHNPSGSNGALNSAVLQPDGKVVIIGNFFMYKGYSLAYVARLNTDGSVDTSFSPGTGPGSGSAYYGAMQSDGKIIIVGTFSTFNGVARTSFARLGTNGALDMTLDAGVWTNGVPKEVTVLPDGKIMIVGATTWDASVPEYVDRFLATGPSDTTFNYTKAGANGVVDAIVVLSDGGMLVGGNFTAYNGTSINRIAKLK